MTIVECLRDSAARSEVADVAARARRRHPTWSADDAQMYLVTYGGDGSPITLQRVVAVAIGEVTNETRAEVGGWSLTVRSYILGVPSTPRTTLVREWIRVLPSD